MRTLKKSEIRRVRGGVCGPATALSHLKKKAIKARSKLIAIQKKVCTA